MDQADQTKLRDFLKECLHDVGDRTDFVDESSLFLSGRLDSLSITRVVIFLEETFHVDFSSIDFEVDLIDSVNDIYDLLKTQRGGNIKK